jgi:hypothetical protein
MFELIGLLALGIWASRKAKERNRNSLTWGLIAVGLYLAFYVGTLLLVGKGFEEVFERPTDLKVATVIFSIGLIGISFAFSSWVTIKLLDRKP